MNYRITQQGFSVVLIVVFVVILLVGVYSMNAINSSQKVSEIEDSISVIKFSSAIEKKQCSTGGIDTSEWCSYSIKSPINTVIKDLKNAGYSIDSTSANNATLTGGNPITTINLSSSDEITLLEAKILEADRTI